MFTNLYRRFFPSRASATDSGIHEYYYPIGEVEVTEDIEGNAEQVVEIIEEHFNAEPGSDKFLWAMLQCSPEIPANESNNFSTGSDNPDGLLNYEQVWC